MIYLWDFERAIAQLVRDLKDSGGHQLFQISQPYEGEFQVPARLPEDYRPLKSYCLTQFDLESPNQDGLASLVHQRVTGQMVAFLGSHRSQTGIVKAELYSKLPIVKHALHGREITIGTAAPIGLTWAGVGTEFALPGHLCLRVTLNYHYFDDGSI